MPGSHRAATKEPQWRSLDWRHGRHLTLLGIGAADGGSRDMVGAEMQCGMLSCDGEWLVTGVRCHVNIWMAMRPGMLTRLSENKNAGCFNSKVLRRQYAEIWEEPGKVQYLYCSCRGNISHPYTQINQTSINGEQLSPESAKSKSFELKTNDITVSLIQNCVTYMHTTPLLGTWYWHHWWRDDHLWSCCMGGAPTAVRPGNGSAAWCAAECWPKWLGVTIQSRRPAASSYPTGTAGSALTLPFIPANASIPRPLPLPNQQFFHPKAHRSFQQPACKNREAE